MVYALPSFAVAIRYVLPDISSDSFVTNSYVPVVGIAIVSSVQFEFTFEGSVEFALT